MFVTSPIIAINPIKALLAKEAIAEKHILIEFEFQEFASTTVKHGVLAKSNNYQMSATNNNVDRPPAVDIQYECMKCLKDLNGVTFYKCSVCTNCCGCVTCIDEIECNLHIGHIFLRIPSGLDLSKFTFGNKDSIIHKKWRCSSCKCDEIRGYRYFCGQCAFSLCECCEQSNKLCSHNLIKIKDVVNIENKSETRDHHLDKNKSFASWNVSTETLKQMLRRENELRLCDETQQLYGKMGYDGYVEITLNLQKRVGIEFNLPAEVGVYMLQHAMSLVTDEQDKRDIQNISLYRKYNRLQDGHIHVGDIAPLLDLYPLYTLSKGQVFLHECLQYHVDSHDNDKRTNRPTVIIASSYS